MNEELQTGIGNKEAIVLSPMAVIVKEITVEEVGSKKSKKVVFHCLHPNAENPIKISQVKWENKGKLEMTGTWFNKDEEGKIKKGSAIANLIQAYGATTLSGLINQPILTVIDDNGYLAFKNY